MFSDYVFIFFYFFEGVGEAFKSNVWPTVFSGQYRHAAVPRLGFPGPIPFLSPLRNFSTMNIELNENRISTHVPLDQSVTHRPAAALKTSSMRHVRRRGAMAVKRYFAVGAENALIVSVPQSFFTFIYLRPMAYVPSNCLVAIAAGKRTRANANK